MQRSIFSRLSTLAVGAIVALAIAATDTPLGRALDALGGMVVGLYRVGSLALYALVAAIPAPMPSAQVRPTEPPGTAHQRAWLIPAQSHIARMEHRSQPAIEPGWRMCPSI